MNDLEHNVIERAKEWYLAKLDAEEKAGQPVNWADFNLTELENAIETLIESENDGWMHDGN